MSYKNLAVIFFVLVSFSGVAYASDWIYPSDSIVQTTNGNLNGTGQNETLFAFTVTSTILSIQFQEYGDATGWGYYQLQCYNPTSTIGTVFWEGEINRNSGLGSFVTAANPQFEFLKVCGAGHTVRMLWVSTGGLTVPYVINMVYVPRDLSMSIEFNLLNYLYGLLQIGVVLFFAWLLYKLFR